jgi:hypothetical protein
MLQVLYCASDFLPELRAFMISRLPTLAAPPSQSMLVRVYNRASLTLSDPFVTNLVETIRAFPIGFCPNEPVEGHFDTVLVRQNWASDDAPLMIGIHGANYSTL